MEGVRAVHVLETGEIPGLLILCPVFFQLGSVPACHLRERLTSKVLGVDDVLELTYKLVSF